MAQKELMLRMINDGEIIGFEWLLLASKTINILRNEIDIAIVKCWIGQKGDHLIPIYSLNQKDWSVVSNGNKVDSVELGIKVGEWWFEGDIGEHPIMGKFELWQDEANNSFNLNMEAAQGVYNPKWTLKSILAESKRISNIHEETNDKS